MASESEGAGAGHAAVCRANPGKYLTFGLSQELYGIEILKVQEIIGMMKVTRVPGTPESIRGVINLRGKVIALLDLRRKFKLEAHPDDERTCIIVTQVRRERQTLTMGIVVDEVREVITITAEQIEPTPEFGGLLDGDFILGIGKAGQRVIFLIDIERVLTVTEAHAAATPTEAPATI